jgi:hypothetical protein
LLRSLSNNSLGAEGAAALAPALAANGVLTSLNLSYNELCGLNFLGRGTYTAEGITAIADAMRVNGGLTSIDLSRNQLCGCIWNDAYGYEGTYTAEGITAIADALRVNGALTVTNLLDNQLDAESAKLLAEVAKQKGISLCGIRRDQTTADFHYKGLKPPDTILLVSDLSQAVVTGALTKLSLAKNGLGEEGTKAICEALEQNKTLKELDISGNMLGKCNIGGPAGVKHVAKMLGINGGLTSINISGNHLCGNYLNEIIPRDITGIKELARALGVNGALTKIE